jgi:hypothetical protein
MTSPVPRRFCVPPRTLLDIHCRCFKVSRHGHRVEECEDAFAVAAEYGRFAIADGAAESACSALWARLLVEEFVRAGEELPPWPAWIEPLQKRWADAVRLPADAEPLPWYLEDRYNEGAFATFLGVSVEEGCWQALAVGDSCLFQVREGDLRAAFPLTHSSQFGNSPWLVGSRTSPEGVPLHRGLHMLGDWQPGDRLLMMTDALSRWFLGATESGNQPWLFLEELLNESDERFAEEVEQLRASRELRNDDTTLVAVCF